MTRIQTVFNVAVGILEILTMGTAMLVAVFLLVLMIPLSIAKAFTDEILDRWGFV